MSSYLAQGLTQGFQTGADAYKSKKERELQKKRDEAEKELRERALDLQLQLSDAQRKQQGDQFDRSFMRQTGRDRADDSRYNETTSYGRTKDALKYQQDQLDREIAQGQATRSNRRADRQLDLAAQQAADAKAANERAQNLQEKKYNETEGPGSPHFALPLIQGQAALANADARKRPTYARLGAMGVDGQVEDFISDEPKEGAVVEQDGVKYRYTNGQWTPIK